MLPILFQPFDQIVRRQTPILYFLCSSPEREPNLRISLHHPLDISDRCPIVVAFQFIEIDLESLRTSSEAPHRWDNVFPGSRGRGQSGSYRNK